jgi:hypothetical protein
VAQGAAGRGRGGGGGCPRRGGSAGPHLRCNAPRRHAPDRGGRCERDSGPRAGQLLAEFTVRGEQPWGPAGACPISRGADAIAGPGRRAASSDAVADAAPERAAAVVAVSFAVSVAQAQAVPVSDTDNHAATSAFADGDAHPHTDTHADANPHANANADTNSDANADTHANTHAHGHANARSVRRAHGTQPSR